MSFMTYKLINKKTFYNEAKAEEMIPDTYEVNELTGKIMCKQGTGRITNQSRKGSHYNKKKKEQLSKQDWNRYLNVYTDYATNNFRENDRHVWYCTIVFKDKRIRKQKTVEKYVKEYVNSLSLEAKVIAFTEFNLDNYPHVHMLLTSESGLLEESELRDKWKKGFSYFRQAPDNMEVIVHYSIKAYDNHDSMTFDYLKAKQLDDKVSSEKNKLLRLRKQRDKTTSPGFKQVLRDAIAHLSKVHKKDKNLLKKELQKRIKSRPVFLIGKNFKRSQRIKNTDGLSARELVGDRQYSSSTVTSINTIDEQTGEIMDNYKYLSAEFEANLARQNGEEENS